MAMENRDPLEPKLPDVGRRPAVIEIEPLADVDAVVVAVEPIMSDDEVLTYLSEAKRMSRNYQEIAAVSNWEQAASAYRSEHSTGSKYRKDLYKNRARYFKPKTRAAVRKNLTATMMALMSSQDVLSCEAVDDGNNVQQANAALIKEIVNARFNNKTKRSGVPWFHVAIGARHDTQIMGMCAAKTDWLYRTREREETRTVTRPVMGMDGQPVIDFMTREPLTETVNLTETIVDVLTDKPVITLIPPESVLIDPASDWIDPAQNSPTLIVPHPMHINAVRAMMEDSDKSTTKWRAVSDDMLRQALYTETEMQGLKAAREGSAAAAATQTRRGPGRFGGMSNEVVEVWECFYIIDGEDYHCWTLRDKALLSDPTPVYEVYPAHRGLRPYVVGTDVLEPHVLYKDSHVHSWKASQDEINDMANIRMDATRQSVYPTAKVKLGQNIDYKAVQKRDQMGVIGVRDQNDVTWDRPPGPPPQIFQAENLLSNDMDELAGIFSQNSVQSNRAIGDTVGGMQLIAANAGATSEFDLRCFIETFIEPLLSQVVMLEQFYEDDATLLAVSGQKAKLWQRYGVDQITDELLESQITVTVNVGTGSSDPMMKLMKFKSVMDMAMPYLTIAKESGAADINFEEIFSEIFGQAGYKNGADRFIKLIEQGEEKSMPAEKVKELIGAMEQLKAENESLKSDKQDKMQLEAAKLADRDKDRQARLAGERMKLQATMAGDAQDTQAEFALQRADQQHDVNMWKLEQIAQTLMAPPVVPSPAWPFQ